MLSLPWVPSTAHPTPFRGCGAALRGCLPQRGWSKHSQLQILGRISPWKRGKKSPAEHRISCLNSSQEQMGASPAPGSPGLPGPGLAALSTT